MLYSERVGCTQLVVCDIVAHGKVGVVLDVVECHTHGSIGLFVLEQALDVRVNYLRHVVVVPPEVLRVIMAIVERRVEAVEETISL